MYPFIAPHFLVIWAGIWRERRNKRVKPLLPITCLELYTLIILPTTVVKVTVLIFFYLWDYQPNLYIFSHLLENWNILLFGTSYESPTTVIREDDLAFLKESLAIKFQINNV